MLKNLKKFWILQFFSCENIRKYLHHPEGYIENISSPWQYISKYSNFVSNSKISYIINIGKLLEEYYKYTSLVARFARHSWCIFVIFLLQFTNIIVVYCIFRKCFTKQLLLMTDKGHCIVAIVVLVPYQQKRESSTQCNRIWKKCIHFK